MKVPGYRRHASGQARVTIAGKDYLLGPWNSKKSKEKYDRLVGEYISSGRSKSFGTKQAELSIAELLVAFKAYAAQTYGVSKRGEYYHLILAMRPLKRLYLSTSAIEFGVPQWKAVRKYVEDGKNGAVAKPGQKPRPITIPSRQYVNSVMQRVTRIFRWAAGDGNMLPGSIAESLERIEPLKIGRTNAIETDAVEPVSDAVVEETLKHLPQILGDMVRVQRLIACRPGELCQLTPGMIDRTGDVWEAKLTKHKNAHRGQSRTLSIGPKAQAIVLPYLLRGESEALFRPMDAEKKRREALHAARVTSMSCGNKPGSNRVRKPLRKPGTKYTTQSYAKAIKRVCEVNGIEHWAPNQLRHAAATEARDSMSLEAAAARTGHKDIKTTMHYAKLSDELRREVARKLG